MILAVFGILCSIAGRFLVRTKEGATQENLLGALRMGVWGASALFVVASGILVIKVFEMPIGIWIALMVGLVAGNVIGYFTEVFTSDHYNPTKHVANSSKTGPATVIIAGLAVGMKSTVIPVITVVIATIVAYVFAKSGGKDIQGLYGIGMAAVGMLSTLGITLATDAYGPVADNAGGVAEMAGLDPKVREKTDALDSLGNTTAATGKGFAIGSAALTALTLLAAYYDVITSDPVLGEFARSIKMSVSDPIVIGGLFIGGVVPFLFSAMTMEAVGSAAIAMVEEVRRQFREIKGIMEGTTKPDYQACVDISTKGALKQMVAPSLLALITPIIVGVLLGPAGVMAMLAGVTVSGFVMAVMMANAGGSWDNAKKFIEKGNLGGKGSDAHKAAVVGDTVGDPFKDTSGPSINILIKLMSVVSIVFGIVLLQIYKDYFSNLLK
jgi:K(+)-stimulated pyrophosphate-energized sodium pump